MHWAGSAVWLSCPFKRACKVVPCTEKILCSVRSLDEPIGIKCLSNTSRLGSRCLTRAPGPLTPFLLSGLCWRCPCPARGPVGPAQCQVLALGLQEGGGSWLGRGRRRVSLGLAGRETHPRGAERKAGNLDVAKYHLATNTMRVQAQWPFPQADYPSRSLAAWPSEKQRRGVERCSKGQAGCAQQSMPSFVQPAI